MLNLALVARMSGFAIPDQTMAHVERALMVAAEESISKEGNWDDVEIGRAHV